MSDIMIGWTTTATPHEAHTLAEGLLRENLAACVQVQEGVTAYYRWKGKLEKSHEARLTVKFSSLKAAAIKEWLNEHHPYELPQWVAVQAADVTEAYRDWVEARKTG